MDFQLSGLRITQVAQYKSHSPVVISDTAVDVISVEDCSELCIDVMPGHTRNICNDEFSFYSLKLKVLAENEY